MQTIENVNIVAGVAVHSEEQTNFREMEEGLQLTSKDIMNVIYGLDMESFRHWKMVMSGGDMSASESE